MLELIDRQAVLEIAMSYCPDDDGCCSKAGHDIREMLDGIEALPTIEAEPVRKPEMSEADRKECEEWCKDCEHIEMCKWYPFGGCDFRLLPKPEQPTIEPEVRHGRWIEDGEICGIDKCKCSLCGGEVGGLLDNTKYCCFRGAKMDAKDGGSDNEHQV